MAIWKHQPLPRPRRTSLSRCAHSNTLSIYIFQTDFSCKLHASTLTIDEGQDNKLQANTRSISSEKTLHFVEYEAGIYLSVRLSESDQGLNTNLRLTPTGEQKTSSPLLWSAHTCKELGSNRDASKERFCLSLLNGGWCKQPPKQIKHSALLLAQH